MKRTITFFLILALFLGLCMPASAGEADWEEDLLRSAEQAVREWRPEIDLSRFRLTMDQALHALDRLYDIPDLFYYENCTVYSAGSYVTKADLHYCQGADAEDVKALEAAADAALSGILPGMDDLQKALVLHDYLALHVSYDLGNSPNNARPWASVSAFGPLVLGTGVCQGYAKAYQLLLLRCGIPARYEGSEAMGHGWNLVKLGESWYHVDVTWDDPVPNTPGLAGHAYFLLSDNAIADEEHRHSGWNAEIACTDTRYDADERWVGRDEPILFTDADTYWVMEYSGAFEEQQMCLIRRNWNTGNSETVYTYRDYWPVWREENAGWVGAFTGLGLWDHRLFFNDTLHIYAYDPATGDGETVFTYEGGEGYIYGLTALEEGILWILKKNADEEAQTFLITPERKYSEAETPEPVSGSDSGPAPESSATPFGDVSDADYFYDAVLWALERGVTKGTGAYAFSPQDTCTRGQVATFLWRAVGCPAPLSGENPFADVPEGQYYRDAVLWAVEQGITNGTGTDTETGKQLFSPDARCSYAHIVTFLWRTLAGKSSSSYGEWYSEPLDWAEEQGLLPGTGLGNKTSGAPDDCPRCDVVTFLWRALADPA